MRQLSEADEDEFIEIMNLVGMTHKPLHVRRLQKALIEWRADRSTERAVQPSLGNGANANRSGHSITEEVTVRNTSASALTERGSYDPNSIPTANATTLSKSPVDRASPIEASQRKSTSDSEQSDRLIEVLESSQSDTELEESDTTMPTRGSPSAVDYLKSKRRRSHS